MVAASHNFTMHSGLAISISHSSKVFSFDCTRKFTTVVYMGCRQMTPIRGSSESLVVLVLQTIPTIWKDQQGHIVSLAPHIRGIGEN